MSFVIFLHPPEKVFVETELIGNRPQRFVRAQSHEKFLEFSGETAAATRSPWDFHLREFSALAAADPWHPRLDVASSIFHANMFPYPAPGVVDGLVLRAAFRAFE